MRTNPVDDKIDQLELLRTMGQTLSDNNRLIAELARGRGGRTDLPAPDQRIPPRIRA